MKIFDIIEELGKVDPELNETLSPRRAAIKNISSFGSKIAVAALPFALGNLFNSAYGQNVTPISSTGASVTDILNFALKLKYLEVAFYNKGLSTVGLIPTGDVAAITTIAAQETAHVALLQSMLGSAAVAQTTQGQNGVYDFTASNFSTVTAKFATVFSNYDTFLAVANIFEDTGVRAYKGQVPNLVGQQTALTTVLKIHSVEARHAAEIRQLRKARGGTAASLKPWISGSASVTNDTAIGVNADAYYIRENNVTQFGYSVTGLPNSAITTSAANISITAAIEAFDEPLLMTEVLADLLAFGVI